jgi:hypothetical protein
MASLAADENRGEAIHDEPRHLQFPAMHERERAAVAGRALEIADLRIPVVAELVDEPEAQPYGIGEVDPGDAPRIGRAVMDAVGGKGEGSCWKALAAPTTVLRGIASPRARISGIELGGHEAERRRRQAGFERAAGRVQEKDVVALLDAWGRKQDMSQDAERHRRERTEPRRALRRHLSHCDDDCRDDEQRVTEEVVDGEPERGEDQHQRGELHPVLVGCGRALGEKGGGQCWGSFCPDGTGSDAPCRRAGASCARTERSLVC